MRRQFTDLDDYGDAVQHARVELCMFRPERQLWTMCQHAVGSLLLQLGQAGGGNICRGQLHSTEPVVFLPLTTPSLAAANGTQFNGKNALLLPPNAEFHLLHTAPHAWCSLTFPAELLPDREPGDAPDGADWLRASSEIGRAHV